MLQVLSKIAKLIDLKTSRHRCVGHIPEESGYAASAVLRPLI
jgi:hypothetical protein